MLGTERHESRRIDNQLRGRSGRQGDPGESRFYLSLGDELMRRFNGATLESLLTRLNLPDDVPIEAKMVTRAIKSAQTQVEQQNFEIRKNVLKYDEVMNQQRKVIYAERRRILEGENLDEQAHEMLVDVVTAYVDGATAEGYSEDWDLETAVDGAEDAVPGRHRPPRPDRLRRGRRARRADPRRAARRADRRRRARLRRAREAEIEEIAGEGAMRQLERNVLLNVLDRKWREHLYEMDYLREGIGLRAMAQRDPVVEYQREGYDMFVGMLDGDEGGVGRLPVQRHRRGRARARPVAPGAAPTGLAEFAGCRGRGSRQQDGQGRRGHQGAAAPAPALRAKGIDDDAPPLTYSGPSEDGRREVQRSGGRRRARRAGGRRTRRERREAARQRGQGDTKRAADAADAQPICSATIRQRSRSTLDARGDGVDPPAAGVTCANTSGGLARHRRPPSAAAPGASSRRRGVRRAGPAR